MKLAKVSRIASTALAAGVLASTPVTRAQPTEEGISPSVSMDYYEVSGDSWKQVLAAIFASRPSLPGTNQRYEGVTSFDVQVGPEALVTQGRCPANELVLKISVSIKLPRLSGASHLSAGDQECWAFYDRQLFDHEEGHMQLALADGEALLGQLRAKTNFNCEEVNAYVAQQKRIMQQNQTAYDGETCHSLTQWRRFGGDVSTVPASNRRLWNRCIGDFHKASLCGS